MLADIKARLAQLLMLSNRSGEAGELLRQAIEIDERLLADLPGVAEYRLRAARDYQILGRLLTALHRVPEAETALRRSLAIREKLFANRPGVAGYSRELASTYYDLGVLLESAGRQEEAAAAFPKSIGILEELAVQHPGSQRRLGWVLDTCPAVRFRDPPRARTLAEQAVRHEPDVANAWTVLGVAQYRTGDSTMAINSLQKAMELREGGGAQDWLFLAMAYWQQGDRKQAHHWYEKAAAWIGKNQPADESYLRFRAEAAGLMKLAK
jgi:eukaryotic-like serine/threonine-protein kinase